MNVTHYRKQQIEQPALGRPRLYDDEERAQRHREAALRWYYKQQARTAPCYFYESGEAQRGR
jgi:hypothetical protein